MPSSEVYQKAMLAMCAFGVGEIIGGWSMGPFIDRTNSQKAVFLNIAIVIIATVLTIMSNIQHSYNVLTYFMTLSWGLVDGFINTHSLETLGSQFKENVAPYAIFNGL